MLARIFAYYLTFSIESRSDFFSHLQLSYTVLLIHTINSSFDLGLCRVFVCHSRRTFMMSAYDWSCPLPCKAMSHLLSTLSHSIVNIYECELHRHNYAELVGRVISLTSPQTPVWQQITCTSTGSARRLKWSIGDNRVDSFHCSQAADNTPYKTYHPLPWNMTLIAVSPNTVWSTNKGMFTRRLAVSFTLAWRSMPIESRANVTLPCDWVVKLKRQAGGAPTLGSPYLHAARLLSAWCHKLSLCYARYECIA